MSIYVTAGIQGFAFGLGILFAMFPVAYLIRLLPMNDRDKKTFDQNDELLKLRGEQNANIERIASSTELIQSIARYVSENMRT